MFKLIKTSCYHQLKKLVFLLCFLHFSAHSSYCGSIYLKWDANTEKDLTGYKIHYGTSSGNYGLPVDVKNVTEYELSGLTNGITYYIALTAHNNLNEESEKSDEVSAVALTINPAITIISPTSSDTYSTSNNTISISGSASDNVIKVIWENNRGGSGIVSGTTSWSVASISLENGQNLITVTGSDAAGNTGADSLTVNYFSCDNPQKLKPISVTASSEVLPFWGKACIVDDTNLTYWSTIPTLFWENEFITLDLGEIKQISRIDMYASKLFNIDFFPVNFQIETSRDNIDWEEIHREEDYNLGSTHSDSWDINSHQARYIRVYITKAKIFLIFYLAQIAEIEVYGCDIPEQDFALLDDSSSIKDEKSSEDSQEVTAEAVEVDKGVPTVPGKPVITFN